MVDPELDFFSRSFNPLKALLKVQLEPPVPNAAPLNATYHFRALLPSDHPDYKPPLSTDNKVDETSQAAKARELQKYRVSYIQQKTRQQDRLNPINEIAETIDKGPLLLLRQCFENRSKVKVTLRHDKGIRGFATGTLVAFDKHWNLVLKDVEEFYTVLLTIERPTASGKMRRCRKQDKRKRLLKQVFIKGSHVVMVQKLLK